MKLNFFRYLFIAIFLSFPTILCAAQCPPYFTFSGEANDDWFGYWVSAAGDLDNDGYVDVVVGSPQHNGNGRVYVYSGKTGDTIRTFSGEAVADEFGACLAATGDFNNDGVNDLIIGASNNDGSGKDAGRVYVFSGADGDTLFTFSGTSINEFFGYSVASAGDVNSDGYDDIMIGVPYDKNATGSVYIFSGSNGVKLRTYSGEAEGDQFGFSVSTAGDVNGDNFDDVIIGAWANDGAALEAGRAYIFSGQTGDTLFKFSGSAPSDYFGYSVSTAGDANRDGYDDVVVGVPFAANGAGRIFIYSGHTGDTLHTFTGQSVNARLGYAVANAGDVNHDGFSDVIVGVPYTHSAAAGQVNVISGKTGGVLQVVGGIAVGDGLGFSVSSAGDFNKDGFEDLLIGAPDRDAKEVARSAGSGHAYIFACCCLGNRGDFNADGTNANVLDLTYLINDIFRGGPASPCDLEADVNADTTPSTVLDLTYLINNIFRGGPAPGACY